MRQDRGHDLQIFDNKKYIVKNHLDVFPEIAEKMKYMTVAAYLNYFQGQGTKDTDSTAGLYELQNNIIVPGQAYFSHLWDLTMNIVTVRAYFNYSQHLNTKDSDLITWYQWLRKIMGTKPAALN